MDSARCDLPECVIPRYQVGQCQYGSVTGNLLLPQGTLQLFPVVADNFIIISAFCFSNGGKHTHTHKELENAASQIPDGQSLLLLWV